MKEQKGITLIALVITIIVLLILAGVSIAMLTGQNGILTQASSASEKTKLAEYVDKINLALNDAKIKCMTDSTAPTAATIKTYIETELGTTDYEVSVSSDTLSVNVKDATDAGKITAGTITVTSASNYAVTKASVK